MTGAAAIKLPEQSHDMGGGKQASELIDGNVSISWTGVKGAVTGNIKHVDDYSTFFGQDEKEGYFFPLELDASYKDKPISVQRKNGKKKTVADTEWVLRLTDEKNTIYTIESEGTTIAELNFSSATFHE